MLIKHQWLEILHQTSQRDLVVDTFEHEIGQTGLEGIPIFIDYTLCTSSEGWVSAMAEQYETSQEDIVQNCLQLGRYIGHTYPWSHKPRASYVGSILSTVRLRARVTLLQEKCTQISQDQKSLIAEVEFLHKLNVDKLGGESDELPSDVDDEHNSLEGIAAIPFGHETQSPSPSICRRHCSLPV
jgi:hypothetical protein